MQNRDMPPSMYNHDSAILRTRLERLLRERELRKSNRSILQNDEVKDNNGDADANGDGIGSNDGDKWPRDEDLLDGLATPNDQGRERQNGRLPKQRLMVVANRLPVSAVRKGEDSWALELSVGGLVSALLGKC